MGDSVVVVVVDLCVVVLVATFNFEPSKGQIGNVTFVRAIDVLLFLLQ